jgi:hypothetical protein
MDDDFFSSFNWHSSIGIDSAIDGDKRFVTRIPNSREARAMFTAAGNNLLIHKTTKCLWKLNGDCIEPVFSSDVLTEDDVKSAMGEGQ